jgi:hypothetical protein
MIALLSLLTGTQSRPFSVAAAGAQGRAMVQRYCILLYFVARNTTYSQSDLYSMDVTTAGCRRALNKWWTS